MDNWSQWNAKLHEAQVLTVTLTRVNVWSREVLYRSAEFADAWEGGLVVDGFCRSRGSHDLIHTPSSPGQTGRVSPGVGPVTRAVRTPAPGISASTPPLPAPKASGNWWSCVPENLTTSYFYKG